MAEKKNSVIHNRNAITQSKHLIHHLRILTTWRYKAVSVESSLD
jgi:hypothetical protein